MIVNMENILAVRNGELLYRDPSSEPEPMGPIDQTESPSPIKKFADVHPHGDVWGWYKQPEFTTQAVNIFKNKQVSNNVLVVNANYMYWPPYNFLTGEDLQIEYNNKPIKFAVLAPAEWQAFFDSIDYLRTFKSTVTGL